MTLTPEEIAEGWQPAETAPKNGREVEALWDYGNSCRTHWDASEHFPWRIQLEGSHTGNLESTLRAWRYPWHPWRYPWHPWEPVPKTGEWVQVRTRSTSQDLDMKIFRYLQGTEEPCWQLLGSEAPLAERYHLDAAIKWRYALPEEATVDQHGSERIFGASASEETNNQAVSDRMEKLEAQIQDHADAHIADATVNPEDIDHAVHGNSHRLQEARNRDVRAQMDDIERRMEVAETHISTGRTAREDQEKRVGALESTAESAHERIESMDAQQDRHETHIAALESADQPTRDAEALAPGTAKECQQLRRNLCVRTRERDEAQEALATMTTSRDIQAACVKRLQTDLDTQTATLDAAREALKDGE